MLEIFSFNIIFRQNESYLLYHQPPIESLRLFPLELYLIHCKAHTPVCRLSHVFIRFTHMFSRRDIINNITIQHICAQNISTIIFYYSHVSEKHRNLETPAPTIQSQKQSTHSVNKNTTLLIAPHTIKQQL